MEGFLSTRKQPRSVGGGFGGGSAAGFVGSSSKLTDSDAEERGVECGAMDQTPLQATNLAHEFGLASHADVHSSDRTLCMDSHQTHSVGNASGLQSQPKEVRTESGGLSVESRPVNRAHELRPGGNAKDAAASPPRNPTHIGPGHVKREAFAKQQNLEALQKCKELMAAPTSTTMSSERMTDYEGKLSSGGANSSQQAAAGEERFLSTTSSSSPHKSLLAGAQQNVKRFMAEPSCSAKDAAASPRRATHSGLGLVKHGAPTTQLNLEALQRCKEVMAASTSTAMSSGSVIAFEGKPSEATVVDTARRGASSSQQAGAGEDRFPSATSSSLPHKSLLAGAQQNVKRFMADPSGSAKDAAASPRRATHSGLGHVKHGAPTTQLNLEALQRCKEAMAASTSTALSSGSVIAFEGKPSEATVVDTARSGASSSQQAIAGEGRFPSATSSSLPFAFASTGAQQNVEGLMAEQSGRPSQEEKCSTTREVPSNMRRPDSPASGFRSETHERAYQSRSGLDAMQQCKQLMAEPTNAAPAAVDVPLAPSGPPSSVTATEMVHSRSAPQHSSQRLLDSSMSAGTKRTLPDPNALHMTRRDKAIREIPADGVAMIRSCLATSVSERPKSEILDDRHKSDSRLATCAPGLSVPPKGAAASGNIATASGRPMDNTRHTLATSYMNMTKGIREDGLARATEARSLHTNLSSRPICEELDDRRHDAAPEVLSAALDPRVDSACSDRAHTSLAYSPPRQVAYEQTSMNPLGESTSNFHPRSHEHVVWQSRSPVSSSPRPPHEDIDVVHCGVVEEQPDRGDDRPVQLSDDENNNRCNDSRRLPSPRQTKTRRRTPAGWTPAGWCMTRCRDMSMVDIPAPASRSRSPRRRQKDNLDTTQVGGEDTQDCLEAIGEGRLLADFIVFIRSLQEEGMELERTLWLLETSRCLTSRSSTWVKEAREKLQPTWEAYLKSPEGKGNFDDTAEWAKHELPASSIGRILKRESSRNYIDKDQCLYSFAIAAMVGIHVCVTCSDIIGAPADHVEAFQEAFPAAGVESCVQRKIRKYIVPQSGSAYSPRLILDRGFTIEEFCPEYFRTVRDICGVSSECLLMSVYCTDFEFIQFGSNSKSGEVFFFSHDHKFLLKTVTVEEAEVLMSILPAYVDRLANTAWTLLGKYMGLYRLTMRRREWMFVVQRNVTLHDRPITRAYDLKGALRNRKAEPGHRVGLDEDFIEEVGHLELQGHPEVSRELKETLEADVAVLRSHDIMDFSLLLHVHDTMVGSSAINGNIATNWRVARSSSPRRAGESSSSFVGGARPVQGHSDSSEPLWRPGHGVWSADGRYLLTFGLIDILVPFSAVPRVQYLAQHVMSCGHGLEYSRVPPEHYCSRFVEFFSRIVGLT